MMTVAELKEALDDFGDHLKVAVRLNYGDDREKVLTNLDVDDTTHDGEMIVVIDAE